jgi:hypothetical protein
MRFPVERFSHDFSIELYAALSAAAGKQKEDTNRQEKTESTSVGHGR